MSAPFPKPNGPLPSVIELTLIAWHALLANPQSGHRPWDAPAAAIEHAEHMHKALQAASRGSR